MKRLIMLAVLVFLAMPAWAQTHIESPAGLDPASEKLIVRANVMLTRACPGLITFWADVTRASVTVIVLPEDMRDSDYRWEEHGWGRWLEYRITMKAEPESIARWAWPHLAGQTLYFYAGGGREPGVRVVKPGAHLLCNLEPSDEDQFITGRVLAFVDEIQAP